MESITLLVSTQIRAFVVKFETERSLERLMSQCIPIGGALSNTSRARLLQMISDMAKLRMSHTLVQNHVILSENPQFAQSLDMVNNLECLIAAKRHKIIELAGMELATENPAYLRSSQFNQTRFGQLALERSFSSPALHAKWLRLAETVKIASTRLKLLSSILDGVFELFTIIEGEPDYNTLESCMKTSNDRVMKRFLTS